MIKDSSLANGTSVEMVWTKEVPKTKAMIPMKNSTYGNTGLLLKWLFFTENNLPSTNQSHKEVKQRYRIQFVQLLNDLGRLQRSILTRVQRHPMTENC